MTAVFQRIARAINSSGATKAVVLDISKVFDRDWNAGLLQFVLHFRSRVLPYYVLRLFLVIDSLILDGKFSQENQNNAEVPWWPIFESSLFLPYIDDLHDDAICNIAIYNDDHCRVKTPFFHHHLAYIIFFIKLSFTIVFTKSKSN